MKIKDVPLDDIKVGERFRKEMGDIETLAESIKSKGLIQPITINENMELLAGYRRLSACRLAGLGEIPAIIRKTEDELDEKEIELYENVHRKDLSWAESVRLKEAIHKLLLNKYGDTWSERKTARLLEVGSSSLNRVLQIAKVLHHVPDIEDMPTERDAYRAIRRLETHVEVASLLKEAEGDPAISNAVKYAADHYHIGDAIKGLQSLGSKLYNFAEVDPPYAISLVDVKKCRALSAPYTEIVSDEYLDFIIETATNVYRVLDDQSYCVWWFGIVWYKEVREILRKVGFGLSDVPAIWFKERSPGQTNAPEANLGNVYETFFVCRKGSPMMRNPGRANVFAFQVVHPQRKIHPTEKPIELMLEILDTFVYPKSRIVVPFLGSGVTLRACYKRSLVGFGWDLDENVKKDFLGRVAEDQSVIQA